MPDEVSYEVQDRIARVAIANGKANALSPAVVAQLDDALTRAEDAGEEQVGALLITGAPGMLSGGFDLAAMRSGGAEVEKLPPERLIGPPEQGGRTPGQELSAGEK